MKTMIWIVFALLLLTGCGKNKEEESMYPTENTRELVVQSESSAEVPETAEPATLPTTPELLTKLIDPREEDFVRVQDYLPEALVELKYGTTDNFTGKVIYDFQDVFLRYGTVVKLRSVSEELAEQGIGIKIWDGFRPVSAQMKLWEICPDPTYVANPNVGFSNHSRGFAVDLTLVDAWGRELEMPTDFDDFSTRADRDYSDCTEVQAANARLLEAVMEKHGFQGYWGEWWHFNDTTKYDVEVCFDPAAIARRVVVEQTDLLAHCREPESVILSIPAGESVTVLGYEEEFALVEFWGYRGYVAQASLV